ncbi:complement component C7 [Platysternon megacephalum]|uniref:Complement component C7 n=1 Tax=Platysternon megacephalum TaxID=55544 RepID=A0A4D9ELA3_9SAUR|nr:complement component C7 [Platysternon megacephalum]
MQWLLGGGWKHKDGCQGGSGTKRLLAAILCNYSPKMAELESQDSARAQTFPGAVNSSPIPGATLTGWQHGASSMWDPFVALEQHLGACCFPPCPSHALGFRRIQAPT